MTIIENYCKAVRDTGNEIRVTLEEEITESTYKKVLAVTSPDGIACHADRTGLLIKPKVRLVNGELA